jgi:hypothetical protein
MKIHKINPNCSEIVAYMGSLDTLSPDEDLINEVKDIMNATSVKLAIKTSYFKKDSRGEEIPDRVADIDPELLRIRGGAIGLEHTPDERTENSKLVRELEVGGYETTIFYLPGLTPGRYGRNAVYITQSGFGDELVLSISDCDHSQFTVLAEILRAMNYTWTPHDGGHSDSFRDWCNNNGYSDVAEMGMY